MTGPGRPVSADPRCLQKQLRWTESEWAMVTEAAEAAGVQVSDFIRQASTGRAREILSGTYSSCYDLVIGGEE